MPSKPKRSCLYPMCKELVVKGYCATHSKDKYLYDKERGTATERGYNYRWQKARKSFLIRNPLCVECEREGRVESAVVVDHVIPHRGDMDLFWDVDNWQALCVKHHNAKTARGE